MHALERSTPRRRAVALVVTVGLAALACGERSGARSSAHSTSQGGAHDAGQLATPAFSMAGASGSDSTVLRLAAASDTTSVGTPADISVAHVQSVMSDRGFWIGVWGYQVYVVQTASRPASVQGGEAYTIEGTVRAAPRSVQTAPRGMTPVDIEAMHAQHIYIAADSIAPGAH